MKHFYILFFLIVFSDSYSQYVFKANSQPDQINLNRFVKVINFKNSDVDLNTVIKIFKNDKSKTLKYFKNFYGYSSDNYWGKLSIQNENNKVLRYFLTTATPATQLVELYVVNRRSGISNKYISGVLVKKDNKVLNAKEVVFDLNIDANANLDIYIHINTKGDVVGFPTNLYSYKSFFVTSADNHFVDGVFLGLVIQFSIFMFLVYFAIRKIQILILSAFILFSGIIPLLLDGYFLVYFGVYLNEFLLAILVVTGLLLGKFVELTLSIKKNNPSLFVLFQLFYICNICLLLLACMFSLKMHLFFIMSNVLGFLLFSLIGYAMVVLKYKITVIEVFFMLGVFCISMGYVIQTLKINDLIGQNLFIDNSAKIGIALTIVLFTIKEVVYLFKLRVLKNNLRKQALNKAIEMKDLKCYLLCNISHELRTPLNVIVNLNKYILEKSKDPDIIDKCKNIQVSSEHLLDSINDILDFSKIEKRELKLNNVVFDPLVTLIAIKDKATLAAAEKGVEFNFSVTYDFPELIIGDQKKFFQIVNNVMSNALKFTSKGHINFNIESQLRADNRVGLVVAISDTGLGIKEEKIDSIFESFSQYKIDNKRKFGGLGLGLFLVKNLVDILGGTFSLESLPGKGTNCKIEIDFEIENRKEKKLEKVNVPTYDLGGKVILVVEDNKMNQMVIKMITKKWFNTEVIFSDNGLEALKLLKVTKIDVILMDLQMPIMDGYETTIAIRSGKAGEKYVNIPIIAVTADVMEETKIRVIEIGMNCYMSKPINKECLYYSIKKLL